MSAFMSDRTPDERRYFRLQLVVYDILRAEDGGRIVAASTVDGFVNSILACDFDSVRTADGAAHPDWHLCCEPTEAMLAAGYIDADGERQDLTPDEMRSLWFRMHAAIRRDA